MMVRSSASKVSQPPAVVMLNDSSEEDEENPLFRCQHPGFDGGKHCMKPYKGPCECINPSTKENKCFCSKHMNHHRCEKEFLHSDYDQDPSNKDFNGTFSSYSFSFSSSVNIGALKTTAKKVGAKLTNAKKSIASKDKKVLNMIIKYEQ